MKRLAPSILSADFSKLGEDVKNIENAGAHIIHVDVMDGHFVPNISYGAVVMKSLLGKTKMPFDVHLMIEDADKYIGEFVTDNTEFTTWLKLCWSAFEIVSISFVILLNTSP